MLLCAAPLMRRRLFNAIDQCLIISQNMTLQQHLQVHTGLLCVLLRADGAPVSCRWRRAERRGTCLCARHEFVKFYMMGEWSTSVVLTPPSPQFTGAPVAVGMNIDIASIDMVSEVNMVGVSPSLLLPSLLLLWSRFMVPIAHGTSGLCASYHGSMCVREGSGITCAMQGGGGTFVNI